MTKNTVPHEPSGCCPLWQHINKPWRKRHPFLLWGGLLVLFFICLQGIIIGIGEVYGPPKIGVVKVEGTILTSENTIEWMEELRRDDSIKGVLVRVNSPGGAVTPSQEIYFAMQRLARAKPVVVSMGTVAASGGYYISLPAHHIYAAPSTLTGSIGVRMELPNVEKLLDMIGLSVTSLASGDMKNAGTPTRPMTPQEEVALKSIIMDMHTDFVDAVTEYREIPSSSLAIVTDGRAFTGRQALAHGLVDALGDQKAAVTHLASLAGLNPLNKVRYIYAPTKEKQLGDIIKFFQQEQMKGTTMPTFFY